MTKEEAKKRIAALTEEINRHNQSYYMLDKPIISDYDFDKFLEELMQLEKQFPNLSIQTRLHNV